MHLQPYTRLHAPLLIAVLACAVSAAAHAQSVKLPPTSRTVYKCMEGGKAVYSDAPCLGAQRIDVEPTRGLDKSSGQKMTGADVRAERTRERHAQIVGPLLGLNEEEYQSRRRRTKLAPAAKAECKSLDGDLISLETRERSAGNAERPTVQRALLSARQRFKELGC